MLAKIEQLLQEIEGLTARNAEELEALRIKYLSKKGAINELMADFRNVPAEHKKEVGMKLNELKNRAQERIAALKEAFESQDTGMSELDLTRTAYPIELGTRHPLSIVRNEIIDIFGRMGFTIADGPEVEDDLHVFTSLNFAADHPARKPGRCDQKHHFAYPYQQRTGTCNGKQPTSYPHYMSGKSLPQ